MWSEDSNQPAQEAAETHDNFSSLRRIPERAGNGKTPTEFHSRYDRGFKLEEQQPDVQQSFSMSLGGTLERGAHHQALDLSEELPLHHSQNHHHQNHLPHHSHSLASPAVVAGRETPSRVVVPPPYCAADGGGSEAAPELRGSLDCWACSVLVTAQNLLIAAINACLAALVFGTILTPATAMVVFGFLCHSTVRPHGTSPYCSDLLNDGGCVALLVVGFLLVTPLLVLALAAYCRLARHLQLALCFIPYSRAVYKNLPASRHRGLGGGCCCGRDEDEGKGKVWV
ncbi:transmembrane protein 88b [Synchiropus picturatus]